MAKNNGRYIGLFFLGSHYSRFTYKKSYIRKIISNCIQQLIEPDTFS